ncbi:MAG: VWA domain-containing protein [Deltaproteobacteria bacterium]|nr:VWA domain-containing protein [Deltaproteobacteria bacterium]
MKETRIFILIVSFLFLDISPVRSDDSDIFGRGIEPNVLILFDSSTSMNSEAGTFIPYDPNTIHPQDTTCKYSSTAVYKQGKNKKDCYSLYKATIAEASDAKARSALSTDGFWEGKIGGSKVKLRLGNYLNYQSCSFCDGKEKKIDTAKRVVTNLIKNVEGVRFGVMRLRKNGGKRGEIVAPIGTDKSTIISAVNSIQLEGGTPLGEQLRDAGLYYKGQFGFPSPIQFGCQPNFVIIVSDGMQNGKVDVRKEATSRYTQDHASALAGTQNVIVHTVGFSIDPNERAQALDVLQQAARNGAGSFYTADNSVQLERALHDAIRQIIAATFSFTPPVIPATSTTGSTKAYIASFKSDPSRPFWHGFLKAYQRDSNGQVPVDSNGVPLDSALVWEAGQRLSEKSSGSRTIYTAISGSRQEFTRSNTTITPALLGVSTSADRDKVIDFIRGIDAFDEDADLNVTEERAWKLGDIFHSTPVLVSPPFSPSTDSSYVAFKEAMAKRTSVLITGANDGMLHAFRESDGEELWAFIPPDILGRLKDLTVRSGEHSFYLDSSPIAVDIKIGGNWRTIVVFGERRGGKSYHALDVTDTTNPSFLWTFTDSKMGESWSEPAIGKVKMSDGTEKFVAFVGGGYDTAQNNNSGKAFFVIDLAAGAKLWEYFKDGSADDRQHMNFSLAASPTAADLNNDGFIDSVYIGDIGGQLWKFDVTAGTLSGGLVTNWTGKRLFAAAPSQANPPPVGEYYPTQAIYAPPALAFDANGNLWVFFGTGDRNHPNNTSANRFYGVKDNTTMTNGSALTESSLVDVTPGTGTVVQGWFFRLAGDEKVVAAADVFAKIVFFSTFTPTSAVACGSGGGTAKLYAVNMPTGDAAIDLTTGQTLSTGESALTWAKAIGVGIPSKPIVIISQSGNQGNPSVITGTTNQQLSSNPAPSVSLRRLVGWREVF